jgi:hypothetical protein
MEEYGSGRYAGSAVGKYFNSHMYQLKSDKY